jgi:hypothetical protein
MGVFQRIRQWFDRSPADPWERLPPTGRPATAYIGAALLLIILAVITLELAYTTAPMPPGVDPGDWLQRSYAYVGLSHPPQLAIGSPYLYPPVIFPPLGFLVLVSGSPENAGMIFGGTLLAAFGLSSLLLARRALATGPFQVAFVGLSVLNGTTVAMLFWGGYPNFAGFVTFDLAIFFLISFLQTERAWDAVGLWGFTALTYLTHSLTFDLLIGTIGAVGLVLLLSGRFKLAWARNRGHWIGGSLLVGTVVGYTVVDRLLKIPQPDYYSANPSAYLIDNLGELFIPLGSSPTIWPSGNSVYLGVDVVFALIAAGGVAALLIPIILERWRPGVVGAGGVAACAWSAAVLIAPAGGWVFHVDTDYTRFVYFLPQPLALAAIVALERFSGERRASEVEDPGTAELSSKTRVRLPAGTRRVLFPGLVTLGLVLLMVNVTIPVIQASEHSNTGTAHDTSFLSAMQYLNQNPTNGSVLTTQGAARWVEALTDRGAYDIGPTWLLFEDWQVNGAEEAYWALNSFGAVTNNVAVFSYSNPANDLISQSPMYSVYDLGVEVPTLRALPGGSVVDLGSGNLSFTALGVPQLTLSAAPAPSGTLAYASSAVNVTETGTLGSGGSGWLNYSFTPAPGQTVTGAQLSFAPPDNDVTTLHTGSPPAIVGTDTGFSWSLSDTLGQLPTAVNLTTDGTFSPVPSTSTLDSNNSLGSVGFSFQNPDPAAPFEISLHLATGQTSNPAARLPAVLWTSDFLSSYDIHFLLVPANNHYAETLSFFESSYRYRISYQNAEWTILQG